jgi:hypothetical protein
MGNGIPVSTGLFKVVHKSTCEKVLGINNSIQEKRLTNMPLVFAYSKALYQQIKINYIFNTHLYFFSGVALHAKILPPQNIEYLPK